MNYPKTDHWHLVYWVWDVKDKLASKGYKPCHNPLCWMGRGRGEICMKRKGSYDDTAH